MIEGIIGNIIFFGGMLGIVAYCFIRDEVLYHRYMKFDETTEEGKKRYCALYKKDRLESKHGWLANRMSELRDKIDAFGTYFPEGSDKKAFLHEMRVRYKGYFDEFYRTNEAIADWEKLIDEIVAELPKKYRGIREYDWRNAKVEIEEVLVK